MESMPKAKKQARGTRNWVRDKKTPPSIHIEVFDDGMTASKARAAGRWASILGRCYAPHTELVARDYRDRGIRVDPQWHDFEPFYVHMYQVIGPPPPGTSIDRCNNNGPYSPENCRWATRVEQSRNRRFLGGHAGRLISACGKSMTIGDWARDSGIDEETIRMRLKLNWDPEEAVTLRPGSRRHKRRAIALDGVNLSTQEWSQQPGVSANATTIGDRFFRRNWSARDAIFLPPNTRVKKGRNSERIRLTARGRELTPEEWAAEPDVPKGIKPATIYSRYAYLHWPAEEAIFTSPCENSRNKNATVPAQGPRRNSTELLGCAPKNHVASFPDGMTYDKARLARIWAWMLERCYAPRDEYTSKRYRDRGIRVDRRWHRFSNFYEDMYENKSPPPSQEMSLDRRNNDGPYSPENCDWATAKEQANNRSNSSQVTAFGEIRTYAAWEERFGVDQETIRKRILNGEDPEDAVSRPRYGRRKDNVLITHGGESLTASEWARRQGSCGSEGAILNRHKNGWSPKDAIFTDLGKTPLGHKSNRGQPIRISFGDRNLTCAQWAMQPDVAEELTAELIYKRFHNLGWSAEHALFTPKGGFPGPNAEIRRQDAVEKRRLDPGKTDTHEVAP